MDPLPFGAFRPLGWLRRHMHHDLTEGPLGCLDRLVPELITADDIYGAARRGPATRPPALGTAGDAGTWDVQHLWWNSETQSNWWDGLLRHALLLDDPPALDRARRHVDHLLSTQDADGYLGIYTPELRFGARGENGELWALATAGRGLLAWAEATGDPRPLSAVERAVRRVMTAWPPGSSRPFGVEPSYAGTAHGLMLTDVLERLTDLTGDPEYRAYAGFLVRAYAQSPVSETDILPASLRDAGRPFRGHGVHTYEHLRALLAAGQDDLVSAYLAKLLPCLLPSGAPIGDEWISPDGADPDTTGYECCSLQELLDSYGALLRHRGDLAWADRAERLAFNAALGARHPEGDSLTYLKTDNCQALEGPGPGHHDGPAPDPQVRYRYSPVHQEAAVCCVPNAGRLFPTYLRWAWFQRPGTLTAALYAPGRLSTEVNGQPVTVTVRTEYPWDLAVDLTVDSPGDRPWTLELRVPSWAAASTCRAEGLEVRRQGGLWVLRGLWGPERRVALRFEAPVREEAAGGGRVALVRGPLVYALALPAVEGVGRTHPVPGFRDRTYRAAGNGHQGLRLVPGSALPGDGATLSAVFTGPDEPAGRRRLLVPLGRTILRQVTFALGS